MAQTPAQIADDAMSAFSIIDQDEDFNPRGDVEQVSADFIRDQIIAAIEADRAQRNQEAEGAAEWAAEVYENMRQPDYDFTGSWDSDSLAECATWAARKALGIPAWEGEGA